MRSRVNTHGQEAAALLQRSHRCDPSTHQLTAHLLFFFLAVLLFCPFFLFSFFSLSSVPLHSLPDLHPFLPSISQCHLVLCACVFVCVSVLSNSIPIPIHYRKQMGNWAKLFFLGQHQAVTAATHADDPCVCVQHECMCVCVTRTAL